MKNIHKLFFAIPFDTATKELYKKVCEDIRIIYPNITITIGNQIVGPSIAYSEIASFRAQNRELNKQFKEQIQDADIIIADLTNNNPNVHVELGWALQENKNILRVTGRSVSELAFDIRNLEVQPYKDKADLLEKITDYLKIFFDIKKLPLEDHVPSLYFKEPNPETLFAVPNQPNIETRRDFPINFLMRDGAVKVEFEIVKARTPIDWFGLFFRSGPDPTLGSNLIYIRNNGILEIVSYPNIHILKAVDLGRTIAGRQLLTAQFENNYLEVQIGSNKIDTEELSHQSVGMVLISAYCTDVNIYSLEMMCRDTIEW